MVKFEAARILSLSDVFVAVAVAVAVVFGLSSLISVPCEQRLHFRCVKFSL